MILHRDGIALVALACAVAVVSAQAQEPVAPVWRCGNSYSHQPCAAGETVDVRDARSAEQRRQADLQTGRMRALGDTLHRETAAREAQRRSEAIAQQQALSRQWALQSAAARKAQSAQRRRAVRRRKPSVARRVVVPQPAPAAPTR